MAEDKQNRNSGERPEGRGTRAVRSFMRRFRERFFLRFHMSLILMATALSGLLATKLLLMLQVESIVLRYPLVVIFAYLTFFLFIKLWLIYLSASRVFDVPDIGDGLVPDFSGMSAPDIDIDAGSPGFGGGGGGTGGGGGVTGSFDGPTVNAQAGFMPSSPAVPESSSGIGDFFSGIFDIDDDGFILIAIGLLLAVIFGSAFYLIYIAPHILSEAAFDFLLGSSLIKSYKKMNKPDWMGSVFKDTYKPFLVVLVVTIAVAWFIHFQDPTFTRITDLFTQE